MKYSVPVAALKAVINPLDGQMWKVDPIAVEEVVAAAEKGEGLDIPWPRMQEERLPPEFHRIFHIRRIAWLLDQEFVLTDAHKIALAVSKDRIWFYDGNHRAAAAIVRGDDMLDMAIASSNERDLNTLFPGLICLEPDASGDAVTED